MKSRVLHLSVGQPSGAYGTNYGNVTNYVDDATTHVREIASQIGAHWTGLLHKEATRAAAAAAIREAREALRDQHPSLFVLSFSGHGSKISDEDSDEVIDQMDEAWALDDTPLIDDEIMRLLDEFGDHVHIAIISNCCFAAGISDPDRRPTFEESLAARRKNWFDAVAKLEPDKRFALLKASQNPKPLRTRKRVLAAVCQVENDFLAPSKSAFTSAILDTVFPLHKGTRHRDNDVIYAVLGERLRMTKGLPLFAAPSVTGPADVLKNRAFLAI